MRDFSETEIISLASILKMENEGLIKQRLLNSLIMDEDLKREGESRILAIETRIKTLKQFIDENQISIVKDVE
ncbi:hypothetical protein ACFO6R_05760 [Eubacterium multiforme]|uniref:Phosphopantetheine adenylyltransferase n=1 Tax=Eubacterium multiforme TaxID=83339 RepID=A0ABT9UR19_9FIRM|nr:hypothetical protein [Eubacterium multiforme]MDQ0149088.1 phosphopantetheine adenylyltransferase [Eubacterium multiforme]